MFSRHATYLGHVSIEEAVVALKPKLRGWLHAGAAPTALACGVVLVLLAPPRLRLAAGIYAVSAVALFSISATFHRGAWRPRTLGILQRLDHATIFVLIAGSYTPFAAALLGSSAATLLWIVWCGALLGMAFRVFWVGAPRWLTVPCYIALGWSAAFYLPEFWDAGGAAVVLLIGVGGLLYSVGGVVYAMRRPDPSPRWFGYHEVFHSFTLGGFASHYVAISLAIYGASGLGH